MKILVIKIQFQIFSVFIDYSKFSLFDQQILDHFGKKYISLNKIFHFPGDCFSSKFQEIEMEFQEISRRWPPCKSCSFNQIRLGIMNRSTNIVYLENGKSVQVQDGLESKTRKELQLQPDRLGVVPSQKQDIACIRCDLKMSTNIVYLKNGITDTWQLILKALPGMLSTCTVPRSEEDAPINTPLSRKVGVVIGTLF